ncbi:MAG: hypothetical protein LH616_04990 [Ilumatobacteraceae bacterium]|nr:hypothetical protein [Ilumatobacteraceae bacterium]
MPHQLVFTTTAKAQLEALETTDSAKARKVKKTLGLLQANPRHPGLYTQPYSALEGPQHEKVFEAYVENNTPGAYRVFWYYGPGTSVMTIVAITSHP